VREKESVIEREMETKILKEKETGRGERDIKSE
jgi:hypothetical protein